MTITIFIPKEESVTYLKTLVFLESMNGTSELAIKQVAESWPSLIVWYTNRNSETDLTINISFELFVTLGIYTGELYK